MKIYNVHSAGGLRHFRFLRGVATFYGVSYHGLAKLFRENPDAKAGEVVTFAGLNIWKAEVE
jgi:hypothetical protein